MTCNRPAGLANRSLTAAFWGGGGSALRLALQLGIQVALARILGPQQYGVFAIGATVISFSAFLSDIGLAYGLIQKSTLSDDDVRFVFTWQIALGLIVTAGMYFLARPIAGFFGEPQAASLVQAMSVLCLLNALAAPSLNLLKRKLDFRAIQVAQVISYLIGYLVCGIPLALAGAGYWALVAAWIVQSLFSGVMLYRAVRHSLQPLIWYAEGSAQGRYALTVLATNLTNWQIGNIDRVIIGRVYGSHDIGLYATFYNLLYNPTATLLGIIQPVFFSASARIADDPQRIARGYRSLIGALTLIVLPLFAGMAVLAEWFVLTLYGPAWHQAAYLCAPLALAMPLFLLFGLTTPLLWTSGRAHREFLLQLPVAVLWLLACALAAKVSLLMVAWTVLALFMLRTGIVVLAASRAMHLNVADLWRTVRGGLLVSAGCALAASLTARWLPSEVAAWLRLVVGILSGALAWLVLVWAIPGLVATDTRELYQRVRARLPRRMARFL